MKIAEIAKAAGVSVGTVDRVLHNRGRVSIETKTKIEKIIKENGYVPNAMARNLKMGSKLKFGVLIPKLNSENGYWNKIHRGIIKASKEIESFNISIEILEFDREKNDDFLNSGKVLLEKKVDAIALAPVIHNESNKLIKELNSIPYAFFDSSLFNSNPISENVQNAYKAGWCAARLIELFNKNGKNFICIQMHNNAYNQIQRAKGFMDYFSDKELTIKNYIWNKNYINNFIDKIILENKNIDGVFITNDATGLFSKYFRKKYKNNLFPIIGFDLVENNKEELKKGNISALISQSPEIQGYNTIMDLYKIIFLKQTELSKKNNIPINIIIKENL